MTTQTSYAEKSADYFNGERRDLIDRLYRDPARIILEIGCGDGATPPSRWRRMFNFATAHRLPHLFADAASVLTASRTTAALA